MRVSRLDEIEQYLNERRSATIEELCEEFNVSKNTIRRDLDELVSRGSVKKVYGGAVSLETRNTVSPDVTTLVSFQERMDRNADSKQLIAALAATKVLDHSTIFVDSGSTTVNIVDHLKDSVDVTLITGSIAAINKAMNYPNINLIAFPGILKRNTASLYGSAAVEFLETYNIDCAFMACTSISIKSGVCNSSVEEYYVKKAALRKSIHHYLLADSSKLGKTSLLTYADINEFDSIITEKLPSKDFREYCSERGCSILIASPEIIR